MLAFEETGKYVSERHAEASITMLTAGCVAGHINCDFKPNPKVTAKELKPFADEWHHAGFYKGNHDSTMGRTYFFSPHTNFKELYRRVCENRKEAEQIAAEQDVERYFFSAGFERRRINRFGKLGWKPIAVIEAINCKPSDCFAKKDEINREDYELLKPFIGEDLETYESFHHFKTRMLKVQNESQKIEAA